MNRSTQLRIAAIVTAVGLLSISVVGLFYWRGHHFKKYKNEAFSINYPSDWTLAENKNGAAVIFFSPVENELDYFQESLNVVIDDISDDPISLSDYSDKAMTQMKVVFQDKMEVIDSSPTTLNNHAAHRFIFKGSNTDVPLQYMCVWTIDGTTAYQLTYTAFASKYDLFVSKIKSMINSFRVLK